MTDEPNAADILRRVSTSRTIVERFITYTKVKDQQGVEAAYRKSVDDLMRALVWMENIGGAKATSELLQQVCADMRERCPTEH